MSKRVFGKVYLVGAGPGDPGLVTVKAAKALKKADVVIYDFLTNARLLDYARVDVLSVYVGKKGRFKHIGQDDINRLIVKHAKQGRTVVRLKGGDPMLFARVAEEALWLQKEGIEFELVPGVSSASAAPAYAGIALTHRDAASAVTIITGQESLEKPQKKTGAKGRKKTKHAIDWKALSDPRTTVVILMGWKNLASITEKLIKVAGRRPDTPVALVRWGTLPKQTCLTGTLSNIAGLAKEHGVLPPVVTIVGDVVRLRDKLAWFDTRPLSGRRVLVTRTSKQAGVFAEALEGCGAEVVCFPVIKTVAPKSWSDADRALKKLSTYDWIILTSVNTVNAFFDRLYEKGLDVRELKGVKICAVGPATQKAIKGRGLLVDLVPEKYKAEGVIKALGRRRIKGKKFLLPRAEKAREVLPDTIKEFGGVVDIAPVYRTVRPVKKAKALKELLEKGEIDVVTFTSSSTVTNFSSLFTKKELPVLLNEVTVACIGPVTAQTAKAAGLTVDIMPAEYTIPAFTDAIAEYYKVNIPEG